MSRAHRRTSLGGGAVERSLRAVGCDIDDRRVALVETARPAASAFDAVLAQNAWNVVDSRTFADLAENYPRSMVRRMRARRAIARVNLRRAGRVVCLSEYMADLVSRAIRRDAEVSPVWLPMDFLDDPSTGPDKDVAGTVGGALVPGTVTWFKDPAAAIPVALAWGLERMVLAGRDDGSGCWEEVRRAAARAGVTVGRTTLDRDQMRTALMSAPLVVLPSRLESLGFSLGESLAVSATVVASPLPSHREVARRAGGSPVWTSAATPAETASIAGADPGALTTVAASWAEVGRTLDLAQYVEPGEV